MTVKHTLVSLDMRVFALCSLMELHRDLFPRTQRAVHSRNGRRGHRKRLYNGHYAVQKSAQRYVRTGHFKENQVLAADAAEAG